MNDTNLWLPNTRHSSATSERDLFIVFDTDDKGSCPRNKAFNPSCDTRPLRNLRNYKYDGKKTPGARSQIDVREDHKWEKDKRPTSVK